MIVSKLPKGKFRSISFPAYLILEGWNQTRLSLYDELTNTFVALENAAGLQ